MANYLCAVLCVLLNCQLVLCQFGFFPQHDQRRYDTPFQFGQNFLQNPRNIRDKLSTFLHLSPETSNGNGAFIYPFNNRPAITNDGPYNNPYGRPPYQNNRPNFGPYENNGKPIVFPTSRPQESNLDPPNNSNNEQYVNEYQPTPVDQENSVNQYQPSPGQDPNSYQHNNNFQNTNEYETSSTTKQSVITEPPNYNALQVTGEDQTTQGHREGKTDELIPNQDNPDSTTNQAHQNDRQPNLMVVIDNSPTPEYNEINFVQTTKPQNDNSRELNEGFNFDNRHGNTQGPSASLGFSTLPPLTPVPAVESKGNINFGSSGLFTETCNTIEGGIGSCISVYECDPYLKVIQDYKTNPEALRILRQAHCGFSGSNPKVCCPRPGIPTAPPTEPPTTTSTTTTTTTVAPSTTEAIEKTAGTTDYVTAFPEPPICGVSNASFSRVVGGIDAKLGDFPWMALLGYKSRRGSGARWLCGGSLISSKHVLTAAHCIHRHEDDLYLVRLGELDLSKDDEGATPVDVLIKSKIKHEGYNPKSFVNDIGILVLEREVQFTHLIKPICIPKDSELRARSFENYNPIIAGWGDTEFRGPSATHLQALQLPVVSNDGCVQAYSRYKEQKIDEKVLCAGYKQGGKDACQGDSGGPLMQPIWNSKEFTTHFYQIGVVSYGKKCAEAGYPGVYSRVTYFVPWLEKVLGIV